MIIYGIIDRGGYDICSDCSDYWSFTRTTAYLSAEKAYEQIINEIENGQFTSLYNDPIIVPKDLYPTIEELKKGWDFDFSYEYSGYKIIEMEVVE